MALTLPPILQDVPSNAEDRGSQIKAVLASALTTSPLSGETAEVAADQLSRLFPPDQEKAEEFLWALWGTYLTVVQQISVKDPRMDFLVEMLQNLKALDKGTIEIWDDPHDLWGSLPIFGPSMREEWNFSIILAKPEDLAPWISLNSFAARLHGRSVHSCYSFAVWEFREAFETDYSSDALTPAKRDCNLATTSQWILHAGPVLYEEARNPRVLDETDKRRYKTGKLTEAEPGMNLERWVFWRERLEELGAEAGEEVKDDVAEAVRKMKELEGGEKA
ncbi:Fc.00g039120.m01.CDS01 [Cosmosporella sp. VM-42]